MFGLAICVGVLVVAALRYHPAPPTYTEPSPVQTAPRATIATPVGPAPTAAPATVATTLSKSPNP